LHIMKYLIDEQGCDPSCLDTDQETTLHHAACKGYLHVIRYLIDEQRCYSSSLNRDKETPFHLAAYSGYLDFVKFLTLKSIAVQHQETPLVAPIHLGSSIWPFGNT